MFIRSRTIAITVLLIVLCPASLLGQTELNHPDGQDARAPNAHAGQAPNNAGVADEAAHAERLPEIPDEPRAIDPATLVPEELATPVTVDFDEASLNEVAQWIRQRLEIPVLFDTRALADEGIPLGEPVTDRLDNEPLYLLLNRLTFLGLAWYFEDDVLHITSNLEAEERVVTQTYNVRDLLDEGYTIADFTEAIERSTAGGWQEVDGGPGNLQWLGDVLFVRNTDQVQQQISGLLAALRNHGRQTFIFDPPQHGVLREKLDLPVSVSFDSVPLVLAVEELAELAEADIRLDRPALGESGIRDRQPVSLTLSDRKLMTVLDALLADLGLTWILRDGVMWITSDLRAEESLKTAIYDVRDLCRDRDEAEALHDAIFYQSGGQWMDVDGGPGELVFARPGTMVVRQTENIHRELDALLAAYRQALRESRPREPLPEHDPDEVITRYYRLDEEMAISLAMILPELVQPDSWISEEDPDAPGRILVAASSPELLDSRGQVTALGRNSDDGQRFLLPQSVLIIRQRRAAHEEIAGILGRVRTGDTPIEAFAPGMGPMGMGGFGGGFMGSP